MSVMALEKRIVVDTEGRPVEVVIPYEKFVEFIETYGLDLSDEEKEGILEAKADIEKGNWDAFSTAEEVKIEVGCTN